MYAPQMKFYNLTQKDSIMDWPAFAQFRRQFLRGEVTEAPADHPEWLDQLIQAHRAMWQQQYRIAPEHTRSYDEYMQACGFKNFTNQES